MGDNLQVFLEYTAKKSVGKIGEYVFVVPKTGDVFQLADLEQWQDEVTPQQKKILYIEIECCSGSDYSNTSHIAVSNHRSFLKLFKHIEGVHDFIGGFGTFGVVVRADVAESNKEIKQVLDDLENYPVVDEDDMYELEMGYRDEAMKDHWFIDKFRQDFHVTDEYITGIEKLIASDRWLRKQIYHVIDARDGQADWSYEDRSAYLKNEDIVPYLEDELLLKRCKKSMLALLVDRKWSEKQFEEMYEKRMRGERV